MLVSKTPPQVSLRAPAGKDQREGRIGKAVLHRARSVATGVIDTVITKERESLFIACDDFQRDLKCCCVGSKSSKRISAFFLSLKIADRLPTWMA